jgi:hypothetical protein
MLIKNHNGVTQDIESYVREKVLQDNNYHGEDIPLQKQPRQVLSLVSRLLETLLEKDLLTKEEFFEIIGVSYNQPELISNDS